MRNSVVYILSPNSKKLTSYEHRPYQTPSKLAKYKVTVSGPQVREACGREQICGDMDYRIEGLIHVLYLI